MFLSRNSFFNDPFDCVINVDYYSEAERIRRNYFKDFLGDDDLVEYLLSFDSNEDGLLKIAESLKELNEEGKDLQGMCHTFLDDIVGSIAAAASTRVAQIISEDKAKDK